MTDLFIDLLFIYNAFCFYIQLQRSRLRPNLHLGTSMPRDVKTSISPSHEVWEASCGRLSAPTGFPDALWVVLWASLGQREGAQKKIWN